ncbi:MFS transporter [Nocardia sp. CS682]|uniref:MFS transporter n=1 Tax=Nocardia sp. CS682 TaxID=1047172 RepID=UPI001430AB1F|nr:MFS transporter [Nocardia sp. CS682]
MTLEIPAKRRVIGFGGLAVASFLGCIDLTIVTTALPAIGADLQAGTSNTELTLGVFLMALSMFMVTAGRVADHLGRRKVLLFGLALFVVASAGAAAASSIGILLVARFVQGAACAVLYTSTSTLVESLFPPGDRGKAIGWLYSVNGLGLAIGPVLGGLLVPSLGWQSIFWINIPLGLAALVAIAFAVPGYRRTPPAVRTGPDRSLSHSPSCRPSASSSWVTCGDGFPPGSSSLRLSWWSRSRWGSSRSGGRRIR